MHYRALVLLLAIALLMLIAPPRAASAQQPQPKKEKKVWTNDDLEALRGKAHITVAGEAAAAPAASAQPDGKDAGKADEKTAPYVKEKDPKWYRDQLAPLRAELERVDSEIRHIREFRASARHSIGGLVLGQGNIPLSPENQIQQLEAQRRDVQQRIDAIEEQARRNSIAPGELR